MYKEASWQKKIMPKICRKKKQTNLPAKLKSLPLWCPEVSKQKTKVLSTRFSYIKPCLRAYFKTSHTNINKSEMQ